MGGGDFLLKNCKEEMTPQPPPPFPANRFETSNNQQLINQLITQTWPPPDIHIAHVWGKEQFLIYDHFYYVIGIVFHNELRTNNMTSHSGHFFITILTLSRKVNKCLEESKWAENH